MCVCVFVCVYDVCMCVYGCMDVCKFKNLIYNVCMCVCVCVCMCV